MERLKSSAVLASGILGFIVPTLFAYSLYVNNLPQNVATWSMVFTLDSLGLLFAIKEGNRKPYLQIGWALAAGFVLLGGLISKQPHAWGNAETISLVFCAVAIVLWRTCGPKWALVAYVSAVSVSFVPLAVDYYAQPQPQTTWLWWGSIISCLLAILGAPKRDFGNLFVPVACIPLNLIMWYLAAG